MTPGCPPEFVALAHRLADAAGEIARRHFRTRLAVDTKPDHTPVTIADRDAEAAMRELIAREAPGHGVFGEEHGSTRTDAEFVWALDPIDGTKAFITGLPTFGVLIALTRAGSPVLGVIDQPVSRERWIGGPGMPTTLNGRAARVRDCPGLAQAVLYATTPDMFQGGDLAAWDRLRGRAALTRYGADCYAYGLLAAGFVDLVVEANLKPYDYCAPAAVALGAGGVATDWAGAPLGIASGSRVVVAGDGRAHAEALACLRASA